MPTTSLALARLAAQRVTQPLPTPLAVVEHLCALQAQDYAWGLWAIGLRVEPATGHATQGAVEQALAEGTLVRTWPMRRTLHIVAAADVRWMLALLAERAVEQATARRHELGIDDDQLHRSREIWVDALQGGRRLTRSAMLETLEAGGLSSDGQRGYHLLVYHAQKGLLCLGPNEGKEQSYVLLDEWVPPAPTLDRDEALGTLARRYFAGHGPATVQDLARWASLPVGDVRTGLSLVEHELECVKLEGVEYWMAPGALNSPSQQNAHRVHLAAGYDELILGYKERSATISAANEQRVVPGGNGVFRPIVLVDGVVEAGWTRTIRRKGVAVAVELFDGADRFHSSLTAPLAEAVSRYGSFLGLSATVTVGASSVQ